MYRLLYISFSLRNISNNHQWLRLPLASTQPVGLLRTDLLQIIKNIVFCSIENRTAVNCSLPCTGSYSSLYPHIQYFISMYWIEETHFSRVKIWANCWLCWISSRRALLWIKSLQTFNWSNDNFLIEIWKNAPQPIRNAICETIKNHLRIYEQKNTQVMFVVVFACYCKKLAVVSPT